MDKFDRNWITRNAVEEIANYEDGVLTIRGLHYRLVARGMTNSVQHYKRVVAAMGKARWSGDVTFETFSDNDREMKGQTDADETDVDSRVSFAKRMIDHYVGHYSKNRWENQAIYPEIFIEKKALQGVFMPVCEELDIALGACKGYPSLTFLNEAADRFKEARDRGQEPTIIYFGDYDPSGEDIPRSLKENLSRMGVEVDVIRVALMEQQVIDWKLPPAPAKKTDSRTASWDGLGQVELDAVEPDKIQQLCRDAVADIFDEEAYSELMEDEESETVTFRAALQAHVKSM